MFKGINFSQAGGMLPVLIADRLTKVWAHSALKPVRAHVLMPGVLSLVYRENRGMAFSLLSNAPYLPLILSALLLVALAVWLLRSRTLPKTCRVGLWLIFAGGLSNLYDRAAYGFVVDFIRPDFVNFAVFNIADTAVCVGAVVALIALILSERSGKHV